MAISAATFFITYFLFAVEVKLQSFVYLSPLIIIYFFVFLRKTLKEKEVMEEPEQLLMHPAFAAYTLLMTMAYFIAFLLDRVYQ